MGLFGKSRREQELEQQQFSAAAEAQLLRRTAERGKRDEEMYLAFLASLPPASTLVEEAVEKALSRLMYGYGDLARATAIALARKFARPDEQILAVFHREGERGSPRLTAVAFTNGFGVRTGGRSFRVERANAGLPGRITWPPNMFGVWVTLGIQLLVQDLYFQFALNAQLDLAVKAKTSQSPGRIQDSQSKKPRPKTRLIRTARDAELVAAEWMTYLGFSNVRPTPVGTDSGIDVWSDEALAQVKAETVPTGRPKIQQHHGVCSAAGREAIFFSLAGFTPQAEKFADETHMALFGFNLAGEVEPINSPAYGIFTKAGVTK